MIKLRRDFFDRPTLNVAQQLLGKYIIRNLGQKQLIARIVETEAYMGEKDKACHASRGKTQRNWPMYQRGGIAYVYLIYGLHWMFNIVTERKDKPCAVLIRAIQPVSNGDKNPDTRTTTEIRQISSGPGRLCRFLHINSTFNGADLTENKRLFLVDQKQKIKLNEIIKTTRIGVNYAGIWAKKPWRYYLKDNPFVSKI